MSHFSPEGRDSIQQPNIATKQKFKVQRLYNISRGSTVLLGYQGSGPLKSAPASLGSSTVSAVQLRDHTERGAVFSRQRIPECEAYLWSLAVSRGRSRAGAPGYRLILHKPLQQSNSVLSLSEIGEKSRVLRCERHCSWRPKSVTKSHEHTRFYPTKVRLVCSHRPGRTWVVDSRQLISFTFSVQTGQLASVVSMMSYFRWIEPRKSPTWYQRVDRGRGLCLPPTPPTCCRCQILLLCEVPQGRSTMWWCSKWQGG